MLWRLPFIDPTADLTQQAAIISDNHQLTWLDFHTINALPSLNVYAAVTSYSDLRGTNVRKDLQFMTTSSRIKWFEISSFGGGPNICSISLSFCCTKATDVPHHTS